MGDLNAGHAPGMRASSHHRVYTTHTPLSHSDQPPPLIGHRPLMLASDWLRWGEGWALGYHTVFLFTGIISWMGYT